jgi:hypothetical protein
MKRNDKDFIFALTANKTKTKTKTKVVRFVRLLALEKRCCG